MITLGIESTAHTFGVAVLKEKNVLSNVMDSFSTESGGMVPNKVMEHHIGVFDKVVNDAISRAGITIQDIDLIAFSKSPGLGNCLRVGAAAARSLSMLLKKPLIGVNHCIAHLEIGRLLRDARDPVLLYASGANTQIIAYEGGKYRVFGETLDMGIGNFLDSFGRMLGLGFPAGPRIQELAKKGSKYVELPYSVKGMDVSFSGMFTNLKNNIKAGKYCAEDLCYSVQETAFAMLVEVTERAMAHCNKKELLLGGGVACNTRLQEMCRIMCNERGAKSYALPNEYNVDNAAMIAWLGYLMYSSGIRMSIEDSAIDPYERVDDVRAVWR